MRILIVCMGNICRSPVVEAVVRAHAQRANLQVEIASAGTENYHIGNSADPRAIASARARGYDVRAHVARQVGAVDFGRFDHLLVMDRVNLRTLTARYPQHSDKIALFLEFAGVAPPSEVPDPYYGTERDFQYVIDLAEAGARGLIERARQAHNGRVDRTGTSS